MRGVNATAIIDTDSQRAIARGLGSIVDVTATTFGHRAPLCLVEPSAPTMQVRFACGPTMRRLDTSRRIKFRPGSDSLTTLLGWSTGTLDTLFHNGWLILTQRDAQAGAPRGRNRAHAAFRVEPTGVERISFTPTHLRHLGVDECAELIVAADPSAGSFVVVDPNQILLVAPKPVLALLDRHLTPEIPNNKGEMQ